MGLGKGLVKLCRRFCSHYAMKIVADMCSITSSNVTKNCLRVRRIFLHCSSSVSTMDKSCSLCREPLSSDYRRRKKSHGPGCATSKLVLQELMSTMNSVFPTLQDSDALLCYTCELSISNLSTNWRRRLMISRLELGINSLLCARWHRKDPLLVQTLTLR